MGRENVHGALEVVGDGGEVDLDGGFGEASPSHSAQPVTTLPCSEDLLDPAPHAGGDDPRYAALKPVFSTAESAGDSQG